MISDLTRKPYSPLIKPILFACVGITLVACERPALRVGNGMSPPVQTFEHVECLPVNVGNVQILQMDEAKDRRVGDFSISLHDRAMLYLSRKFETRGDFGHGGQLFIAVEAADVQHMQKQSQHTILQRIGLDRVDKYVLRLSLRLEHRDDYGRVLYGKVLDVTKNLNVSEHLSPAEREQAHFEAVEDMFVLLDPQVNQVVKSEMNLISS